MASSNDAVAEDAPSVSSKATAPEGHHPERADEDPADSAEEEEVQTKEEAEGRSKSAKDQGNEEYARGDFEAATKSWSLSLKSVDYILAKDLYKDQPEQRAEVHQMELRLCLNLSQCKLKQSQWREAVTFADRALKRDDSNTKALYRKAMGLNQLSQYDDSIKTLQHLLRVDPENKEGRRLLAETKRTKEQYQAKMKKVAGKMFHDAERDPRVPPTMYQWAFDQAFRILRLPFDAVAFARSLPGRGMDRVRNMWVTRKVKRVIGGLRAEVRTRLLGVTQMARQTIESLRPNGQQASGEESKKDS